MNDLKQYRKLMKAVKVARATLQRHPSASNPELYNKPDHELTFQQFKGLYIKSALQMTKFKSGAAALMFLKKTYSDLIIKSLEEGLDRIPMESIDYVRFTSPANQKLVRKYLKSKGMSVYS